MSWLYTVCNGIGIYRCQSLNNGGVVQAFSTKSAGNMALHTGDDPEKVVQNRRAFLRCIGLNFANLTAGIQTHGVNIRVIDRPMAGNGGTALSDAVPDTDALITCIPGVVLAVLTADCLPLFIYDPGTPAIGVVHAGWRGTLAGIAGLTIQKMQEVFGTKPEDCRVAMGPGICGECFRVDAELAQQFSTFGSEAVRRDESGFTVDLYRYNSKLLIACGIPERQIADGNLCTVCQPETFFSYRASGGSNGRMMGVISLKYMSS